MLAFLPFFHIYGQVVIMLGAMIQGNLLVLFTNPDTEAILAAMERYQATVFFGVPTLYEYLKDHKDTGKVNWRRLKLSSRAPTRCTSRPCSGWSQRTGSEITEGYGLSETAASGHINPIHRRKPGSFGCPVPNMQAAIMDPQTLEFVPAGTTGELVLSGPSIMRGYWRREEENARAFFERSGCAGCAPATSCAWTTKATSTSTTARRT